MSYEYATSVRDLPDGAPPKDDWLHDPVVVVVAKGSHDVSRLIQALEKGNTEQFRLATKITRSLARNPVGRKAVTLLKRHGGADLTHLCEFEEGSIEDRLWKRYLQ